MMKRNALVAGAAMLALVLGGALSSAQAEAGNPAAARIDALDTTLLADTRAAGGGAQALGPVVAQTFNLEVMAQFIVGPSWAQLSDADHQTIIAALNVYVAARLNNEFDGDTQHIVLSPDVQTRGADTMVHTVVNETGQTPANIDYRMRAYDGVWRIIDVYSNGVSVMATQRGDAQAALQSGGAHGLAQHLRDAAAAFH